MEENNTQLNQEEKTALQQFNEEVINNDTKKKKSNIKLIIIFNIVIGSLFVWFGLSFNNKMNSEVLDVNQTIGKHEISEKEQVDNISIDKKLSVKENKDNWRSVGNDIDEDRKEITTSNGVEKEIIDSNILDLGTIIVESNKTIEEGQKEIKEDSVKTSQIKTFNGKDIDKVIKIEVNKTIDNVKDRKSVDKKNLTKKLIKKFNKIKSIERETTIINKKQKKNIKDIWKNVKTKDGKINKVIQNNSIKCIVTNRIKCKFFVTRKNYDRKVVIEWTSPAGKKDTRKRNLILKKNYGSIYDYRTNTKTRKGKNIISFTFENKTYKKEIFVK